MAIEVCIESCDNIEGGVLPAHQADLHFRWVLVVWGMEMDVL